jgi:hypothetical protein
MIGLVKILAGAETITLSIIAAALAVTQDSQVVTLLAALSPIIAAAVGAYLAWKLRQVHVIVNSQRSALEARIVQLETTIEGSDKEVPATTRETGHP